eukprot:CAMPEP_0201723484 /NCGR_PEP_ID=MMETSP0593-20130828/7533_1 /ASSEMBLY_ACC=CAM_ASM_000672 /TAXON_ID=267983 /ORGANISM="Skeletonema japonicum, Strain CCMP2506" /LENGTH=559 /DNA_ID=CAMNT_0048214605 /DNA_START=62 /DNA_END=1741 /DNA_ORIENTATION=-
MPRIISIVVLAAILVPSVAAFEWLDHVSESSDGVITSTSARIFDSFKSSPETQPLLLDQQQANSTGFVNIHPSDHAPLFPLKAEDFIGFFLAALGLILAAGGGIGGGGILVPIYILVLGFMPKHAIPLSNVTVFGGAVANTIRNVRQRHPHADRPLIDWDLILVMEPSTLAGALIGANLNKVLSETVIAVMLVILLTFTAYNTLKKAVKLYKKESVELIKNSVGTSMAPSAVIKDDSDALMDLNQYLLLNDSLEDFEPSDHLGASGEFTAGELSMQEVTNFASSPSPFSVQNGCDNYDDNNYKEDDFLEHVDPFELQKILDEERYPKRNKIALIVTMFLVVLTINILKGGGGFQPLGIQCGSAAFWVAQVALLLWIFMIAFIARETLIKDTKRKIAAGYSYLPEDVKWDERSTVVYPLISTLAGLCGGLFGVGGGIIKGPLMLAMGVHPAVASATSACMIFFTSFTATTTFAVYGLLVKDYAIVCVLFGFLSTLLGQTIMNYILGNSKRNSYIAFSIGLVVLLSALLMTFQSVTHLISDHADEEMSGLCESHLSGPNTP